MVLSEIMWEHCSVDFLLFGEAGLKPVCPDRDSLSEPVHQILELLFTQTTTVRLNIKYSCWVVSQALLNLSLCSLIKGLQSLWPLSKFLIFPLQKKKTKKNSTRFEICILMETQMSVWGQITISEDQRVTNLCVDAVLHLCNYVGDLRIHDLLLFSIISALPLRSHDILTS